MKDTMSSLIEDIYTRLESWGDEGEIDPFHELYGVSMHTALYS